MALGPWACATEDTALVPRVSYADFSEQAYPVLLRDCAFPACHGNSERFFQVYGPGRARIPGSDEDGETPSLTAPATKKEIEVSFARARSMLMHRGSDITMAPLLRKPLQGGAHLGLDAWGRNVYIDEAMPGYEVLLNWASGETFASATDDSPQSRTKRVEDET